MSELNERRAQYNDDNGYEEEDEDFLKPLKSLPPQSLDYGRSEPKGQLGLEGFNQDP